MVYIVIIQVLTFLNCPKTLTNCKYPEPLYILSLVSFFSKMTIQSPKAWNRTESGGGGFDTFNELIWSAGA